MDQPAEKDPRVYFAAERTFLAWIRTGLGLMGIGFAVSRFGLFLRQTSPIDIYLFDQLNDPGRKLRPSQHHSPPAS
jgi:putative membrane protein